MKHTSEETPNLNRWYGYINRHISSRDIGRQVLVITSPHATEADAWAELHDVLENLPAHHKVEIKGHGRGVFKLRDDEEPIQSSREHRVLVEWLT